MPKLVKKTSNRPSDDFMPNTLRIGSIIADFKAKDIKAYDVRGLTLVADAFVLCTATSEPQFRAVINGVRSQMRNIGVKPLNVEGAVHGGWTILDYSTIIVHVFREEARTFYDLDGLWADAPEIELDLEP